MRPTFSLRAELVNGLRHYKASGPDPQADLVSATTEAPIWLPAGHLRFVFEPHVTSGRIVEPTLYIDHGEGFSEFRAFRLQETKPSLWSIDFYVAEDVVRFRFDPSIETCSFFVLRLDAIKLSVTEQLQEPVEGRWLYSASRMLLALIPKFWRETLDRTGTATRLFAEFFPRSLLAKIDYARDMTSAGITVADEHLRTYLHAQAIALGMRDVAYGAIAAESINRKDTTFRPIAFYLPQMHPFPENDRWWGKGFTEWTNVSKAMPQFVDHYQPRCPASLVSMICDARRLCIARLN